MTPAVSARQVGVTIDRQRLLPPTSLSLARGHALAVRGPNGAGKTTLLRVVAGLMTASEGSVQVLGRRADERSTSFRRTLAALIGPPPFARDLTVREQLRFVRATWGVGPDEAARHADDLLDALDLVQLSQRFAHELSSGQSQLFALALTLVRPFDVLLLDEPEQRLDAERRARVVTLLRRRVEDGAAVLFSTHSTALVEALGADVVHVGA
ncbi:MAG: ABC transporter ATP-binding protein [Cellulomonadaceae bacterium]